MTLKRIIFWGSLAAAVYFLMSYHFILFGKTVKMLKKSEPNLSYMVYSTNDKKNETILAIDQLREHGIADLMVEMGRMSEEERDKIMAAYEEEP
ncbi:MAG: hypothetical protein GY864_03000 [Desulfobacterales bacterium]|nr:hypothetical protein [Desulfobacterales bacterium]